MTVDRYYGIEHYMRQRYAIRLKQQPDQTWFAEVEELHGCVAAGDTKEEALEILEEVKEVWLKHRLKHRIPIPEPAEDY